MRKATNENRYFNARMRAAEHRPTLSNRERAAMQLYCSPEALSDYEGGHTPPPCAVVQRMVEVYGDHDLRGEHIRAHCPLISDYGGERSELARAALALTIETQGIQGLVMQFASIARDGKVSPDEQAAARAVKEKAEAVIRTLQESVTAIDNAFAAMERGGH